MHCQPAHGFSRGLYSKRKAVCEMYSVDIFYERVEMHEHVIKNKGNGGGIAQYIAVKLLNYFAKGDLD